MTFVTLGVSQYENLVECSEIINPKLCRMGTVCYRHDPHALCPEGFRRSAFERPMSNDWFKCTRMFRDLRETVDPNKNCQIVKRANTDWDSVEE